MLACHIEKADVGGRGHHLSANLCLFVWKIRKVDARNGRDSVGTRHVGTSSNPAVTRVSSAQKHRRPITCADLLC